MTDTEIKDDDVLAAARNWVSENGGRIQTHSPACHNWHLPCLIGRMVRMVERLSRPASWQDEQAAVEAAFERSGVTRTWPPDEPDQIVPMVNAMAAEIERLREAIRRLADQDATLSVCNGHVTVEMDAAFTDAEREAIERGYCSLMGVEDMSAECTRWDAEAAATLQGLLERTQPTHATPTQGSVQDACTIESLRREIRTQRQEIAAPREERAALIAADRPQVDSL